MFAVWKSPWAFGWGGWGEGAHLYAFKSIGGGEILPRYRPLVYR